MLTDHVWQGSAFTACGVCVCFMRVYAWQYYHLSVMLCTQYTYVSKLDDATCKWTTFALMQRALSFFLLNTHVFKGCMHMQNIDELKASKDDSTTDEEQDDF